MECVLKVDNLSKQYKDIKALDKLSMKVEKGDIYGFVGRNGAGKTTLIRIICGLQNPTSGEYTLYGNKFSEKDVMLSRRRVGAIVETPSVYQDMTAEENILQQYKVLGRPSLDGVQELLELVGLSDAGIKKAKDFSLGMRQRLAIAIALSGNPDFLILDEPVNGLDPQGIVEVRELILKLNREHQITVLISSHILDELSRLATRYGFIDNGRIVKEISSEQLDKVCRKCTHFEVTDIKTFARVLDEKKIEYSITSDYEADVFGQWNITELTIALAEEGCEINKMVQRDENLEGYYINLIGGSKHE
jgi:ABC-2 type transport system ATP-binding protein